VRFKLDENLPDTCAELFRRAELDVATVREQQLGGAPDRVVHSVCHSEGRVLVTLDLDFADIREYPPARGPGIIVFRLSTQDVASLTQAVERLVERLRHESPVARLWIVEPNNIRVRD
jgi:predicted nuclease of predicted toxin-antitoxin system